MMGKEMMDNRKFISIGVLVLGMFIIIPIPALLLDIMIALNLVSRSVIDRLC